LSPFWAEGEEIMSIGLDKIFDIAGLRSKIETFNPSVVVIVDTNIFMNNVDINGWKSDRHDPLFVLNEQVKMEIFTLSKSQANRDEKWEKANKVRQELLLRPDEWGKGFHVQGIGFFYLMSMLSKQNLDAKIQDMPEKELLKTSDTCYLMLSYELSTLFPKLPVVLLTGDLDLAELSKMKGISTCYSRFFPVDLAKSLGDKYLVKAHKKPVVVDFDKELEKIVKSIRKRTATVKLSLLNIGYKPLDTFVTTNNNRIRGALVADGTGALNYGAITLDFTERFYMRDLYNDKPYNFGNGQGFFGFNSGKWLKGDPFSGYRAPGHVFTVRVDETINKFY
jgi:hypothetical protein